MAPPRFSGGKMEERMATLVEVIMAAPLPWMNRKKIKRSMSGLRPRTRVAAVKSRVPVMKTFFRPRMSAMRPAGKSTRAKARIKVISTRPSWTAPALNSVPMAGNATPTADIINGLRNWTAETTKRVTPGD